MLRQKIRTQLAHRLGVPEIPFAMQRLALAGFSPRQIFDVGAYKGDFARTCLEVWPSAKIACFEALDSRVAQLEQLATTERAIQVFPGLLGAESKDNVPLHEAETASSVLTEKHSQDFLVTHHSMRTIDSIVEDHFSGHNPDFLKLDVQGYELEVLKGGEQSLSGMTGILAEVNLLDIHEGVPLIAEIISWLACRGWVAYDICALTRRPLDQALWQADIFFTPENSFLRQDKRWAN